MLDGDSLPIRLTPVVQRTRQGVEVVGDELRFARILRKRKDRPEHQLAVILADSV